MDFDPMVMDDLERIGFQLRTLYQAQGYARYRMSKFEEYDLYSRNKDFLLSDGVITFTDPTGRLLAMKPDVTLSIVKNVRGGGEGLRRLYYHENVYRVSAGADGFREETQVGVECMGQVDGRALTEVLKLASESLALLSDRCLLQVSHLDLLCSLVDAIATDDMMRQTILECAGQKNLHGIRRICREAGLADGAEGDLLELLEINGTPRTVMPRIRRIAEANGCGEMVRELGQILAPFTGTQVEDRLRIDFSTTGDLKYYNGIAFKGYLEGIPDPVLSGGQYDQLMRRMHRKDKAVGFAVFLHRLERLSGKGGQA